MCKPGNYRCIVVFGAQVSSIETVSVDTDQLLTSGVVLMGSQCANYHIMYCDVRLVKLMYWFFFSSQMNSKVHVWRRLMQVCRTHT